MCMQMMRYHSYILGSTSSPTSRKPTLRRSFSVVWVRFLHLRRILHDSVACRNVHAVLNEVLQQRWHRAHLQEEAFEKFIFLLLLFYFLIILMFALLLLLLFSFIFLFFYFSFIYLFLTMTYGLCMLRFFCVFPSSYSNPTANEKWIQFPKADAKKPKYPIPGELVWVIIATLMSYAGKFQKNFEMVVVGHIPAGSRYR